MTPTMIGTLELLDGTGGWVGVDKRVDSTPPLKLCARVTLKVPPLYHSIHVSDETTPNATCYLDILVSPRLYFEANWNGFRKAII